MDKMGIEQRFYCRTMKDGVPPNLDEPLLLAAVRDLKPVVILDTMVRFAQVESENSPTDSYICAYYVGCKAKLKVV